MGCEARAGRIACGSAPPRAPGTIVRRNGIVVDLLGQGSAWWIIRRYATAQDIVRSAPAGAS